MAQHYFSADSYMEELFGQSWEKVFHIGDRIKAGELRVSDIVDLSAGLDTADFFEYAKAHNTGKAMEDAGKTANRITTVWGWFEAESTRAKDRERKVVNAAGEGSEAVIDAMGIGGILKALGSGDKDAAAASVTAFSDKSMRRTQALSVFATALALDDGFDSIPEVVRSAVDSIAKFK